MRAVHVRSSRLIPALAVAAWLVFGATAARADDAAQARDLFTQGNTFFDLGQFDKAIDAWQRGYQLKNDPGFLYNIGQAYRTMGDADKAIFFYKRYLINAPRAKNRAEVEQKIEVLQKQVQERQAPPTGLAPLSTEPPAAGTTPAPPATGSPPPVSAPWPGATTPPPVQAQPVAAPAGEAAAPVTETAPVRRIDAGVALGFDVWSAGLRSHAAPSFAFTLDGGYTFGSPSARARFRLGGMFGYTFLKETGGTDSFTSLMVDPTVVVRVNDRFRVSADLGLGFVSISGMTPTSTLLVIPKDGNKLMINGGAIARGLLRVGVAAEVDVARGFSVFVWPAIASSPKQENFYAALTRVEVLFGAAYRF